MTLLVADGVVTTCRVRLTGEGRSVSLTLSLGEVASAGRFLVSADPLIFDVEAADEPAGGYGLSNWQGGVISGARYAFRALKAPTKQVRLHELRGRLGSGDVWAISAAASVAVARLLGRPDVPIDLGEWRMAQDGRPQPSENVSQGSGAASSVRELPQACVEKPSAASGGIDVDSAARDVSSVAGAETDGEGTSAFRDK